jgi:hypothetical protein
MAAANEWIGGQTLICSLEFDGDLIGSSNGEIATRFGSLGALRYGDVLLNARSGAEIEGHDRLGRTIRANM